MFTRRAPGCKTICDINARRAAWHNLGGISNRAKQALLGFAAKLMADADVLARAGRVAARVANQPTLLITDASNSDLTVRQYECILAPVLNDEVMLRQLDTGDSKYEPGSSKSTRAKRQVVSALESALAKDDNGI